MVLMTNPLTKIFGSKNDRELRRLAPIVDQINSLESKIRSFSDAELADTTKGFRQQVDQGATLDEILPEAKALYGCLPIRCLQFIKIDKGQINGSGARNNLNRTAIN